MSSDLAKTSAITSAQHKIVIRDAAKHLCAENPTESSSVRADQHRREGAHVLIEARALSQRLEYIELHLCSSRVLRQSTTL